VRITTTALLLIIIYPLTVLADVAGSGATQSQQAKQNDSDAVPGFSNFLKCSNFTWMQDCQKINRWVADHPDQPLRMMKDGIEFYFPPGTPSSTIDWVVNQTPESLERYIAYNEKLSERNNKSAAMYNKALDARGGVLRGDIGLDYILNTPSSEVKTAINQKNVAVYVFVDSGCTACAIFEPRIAELRQQYPNIPVSVLQVDNNPAATKAIEAATQTQVTLLRTEQLSRYNIRVFPTIWIEDRRSNHTSVIQGAVTLPDLARHIAQVSK
jgi:hypothetical protein